MNKEEYEEYEEQSIKMIDDWWTIYEIKYGPFKDKVQVREAFINGLGSMYHGIQKMTDEPIEVMNDFIEQCRIGLGKYCEMILEERRERFESN